eukprot:TRINITY_DN1630_c0_g1_i1.p1 TRINITY_DN1630_c0_g1~~TRINITY_DN1630_c0_g1_i1.p1  ORF type:complete len:132 (-),score=26.20 TRINITY_DN1630_c0_g1_i1:6-401(-)
MSVTNSQLETRTREIVKDGDLETLTKSKVISQLESEFGIQLSTEQKKIAKDTINQVLQEQEETVEEPAEKKRPAAKEEKPSKAKKVKPSDDDEEDDEEPPAKKTKTSASSSSTVASSVQRSGSSVAQRKLA